MDSIDQRLGFLFGPALSRGFSRASGPRIKSHSTQRALWAQLAVGYVSAWRPSVISGCQKQQKWDGSLLMSGRDSYSCLFSPIHILQTSLLSWLQGVRELFVFSDQSNLPFYSPTLGNKRSAAFSNLNLVFTLVLQSVRVQLNRLTSQTFTADLHCTSRRQICSNLSKWQKEKYVASVMRRTCRLLFLACPFFSRVNFDNVVFVLSVWRETFS